MLNMIILNIYFVALLIVELFMALYSSAGIVVACYYLELGIIPFMLLFFFGFGIIGYLSIKHYLKKS